MALVVRSAVVLALLLAWHVQPARADEPRLVSVQTPRGGKQAFILIKPDKPVASVILFAGGHGALGLKSGSTMKWGAGNFLVRMREQFAKQGFMVAVIDAPSDKQGGMSAEFRMDSAHAGDIETVAAYLKKEVAIPVWLVGTSMGTFSAARGAIPGKSIDGLVLTSTVTRSKPDWKIAQSHPHGVASMPLQTVSVPTLIVSHRKDGCSITPAVDAEKLRNRLSKAKAVAVEILDGGLPPQSDPCEAKSQHGFLGIEGQAVGTIAKFIKAN